MLLLRRLLVTLLALAVAAGCVTPDETADERAPAADGPTPPTAGLDDTNQTGVPEGYAGTIGAPDPDVEYAPAD